MVTLACSAESVVLISCSQRPAASSTNTATGCESFNAPVNCTPDNTHDNASSCQAVNGTVRDLCNIREET